MYCFLLLLPVSLPRDLSALRHTSLMSFGISIFIVFTIFSLSFKETNTHCLEGKEAKGECYDFSKRFDEVMHTDITATGVFNSLPLIIFGYMY